MAFGTTLVDLGDMSWDKSCIDTLKQKNNQQLNHEKG